jgi:hypothetical protein
LIIPPPDVVPFIERAGIGPAFAMALALQAGALWAL